MEIIIFLIAVGFVPGFIIGYRWGSEDKNNKDTGSVYYHDDGTICRA